MNFATFYKNKTVLITGHTGFKGSWLTLILSELGAKVTGIALEPKTKDDFFVVNEVNGICNSFIADINNLQSLQKIVQECQPDLIFHLAAQPLVRYAYKQPIETFQTNIIGTANILQSLQTVQKACSVVIITTDKVYENKEWHYPYRETDRLGGKDPYSASKACAELIVSSFRNSFFHPGNFQIHQKSIATARAGNVIGGGDWSEDRLLPDIVKSISQNQEILIRNPEAVRPWQLVIEPLFGYLLLAGKLYEEPNKYTGEWNFGPYPDEIMTVRNIVDTAIRILGRGKYRVENVSDAHHEATLLKLDISKAVASLKWKPRYKTEDAIHLTLAWYKELFENRNNIKKYSIQAIHDYLNVLE